MLRTVVVILPFMFEWQLFLWIFSSLSATSSYACASTRFSLSFSTNFSFHLIILVLGYACCIDMVLCAKEMPAFVRKAGGRLSGACVAKSPTAVTLLLTPSIVHNAQQRLSCLNEQRQAKKSAYFGSPRTRENEHFSRHRGSKDEPWQTNSTTRRRRRTSSLLSRRRRTQTHLSTSR